MEDSQMEPAGGVNSDWRRARSFLEAAEAGNIDLVRECLDAGMSPDIDAEGEDMPRAILLAVRAGHVDIVRVLLAAGADPLRWTSGDSPLTASIEQGALDIARLILESRPDGLEKLLEQVPVEQILAWIPKCDEAMRSFLSQSLETAGAQEMAELDVAVFDVDRNQTEQEKSLSKAWEHALYKKDFERIRELLEAGADIRWSSRRGSLSPLLLVCRIPEISGFLLERGADPNFGGELPHPGRRPLVSATDSGNIEAVKLLLRYGARLDLQDHHGLTPAIAAFDRVDVPYKKQMAKWIFEEGLRQAEERGVPLQEVLGVSAPMLRRIKRDYKKIKDDPEAYLEPHRAEGDATRPSD